MTPRRVTIGLLHHTGGGNLGDEGTQAAAIQNIRQRWPSASIIGLTMNPEDTLRRHGIPAYPIRRQTWLIGGHAEDRSPRRARAERLLGGNRIAIACLRAVYATLVRYPVTIGRELAFLVRSFRIVRSLDVLVVNGGGQLTEWGGPWTFTYTVFKWAQLARLAAVRCLFVNLGAGPLTRPLSRWFARRALKLAAYVSFRDEQSLALARAIGFTCAGAVCTDTVYSLDVMRSNLLLRREAREQVVGIAPMGYRDPRTSFEKDQAAYDRYMDGMADCTAWLLERGYRVVLFGTDIGVDPIAVDDLETALRRRGTPTHAITRVRIQSVDDLLAQIASMDFVFTSRYHGVVYAHLLDKPVIAVSTHPKVTTIMDDIGLSSFCIDVERCNREELGRRFLALAGQTAEVQRDMTDVRSRYRRQLTDQFDRLFPPEAA